MSVLWAGNMRGPRLQTPVSVLLLLLLVSGLRHTVLCEDEEDLQNAEESEGDEVTAEEELPDATISDVETSSIQTATDVPDTVEENGEGHGSGENGKSIRSFSGAEPSESPTEDTLGSTVTPVEEDLDLIIIIIPVVLVVLIIALIACGICIHRKMNRHSQVSKEDPYLDDSNTDKVPMPMFEEDVPSVLELEMEELDDWIKKDGETPGGSQLA